MIRDEFPQTVRLGDDGESIVIIDQTKLPGSLELISLRQLDEIYEAIRTLQVRGAPAIGVTAAYGIYIAARGLRAQSYSEFMDGFRRASDYLNSARPTAVNLSWALSRMESAAKSCPQSEPREIIALLRDEADRIHDEDMQVCRAIGEYGVDLLRPGNGILTHCNAGRLAAVDYGTATAPIYVGHERGYGFHVYCDETRPLLQGMRLTAFELSEAGIDTTVICDNMAPTVMRNGWVQAVLVGCDRVAANGDTANKIGTLGVSLAAKRFGVPFYVCAPTSTIDLKCKNGAEIPIEERDGSEVTDMWYTSPMGPEDINVFNPSFDVTDASDITAIITEYGIARPPYPESLKEIMALRNGASR